MSLETHSAQPLPNYLPPGLLSTARLTRRQMRDFLAAHGYPIAMSTINCLCARSRNEGPPVAEWFGARPLYDGDTALAWARSRPSYRTARQAA